MKLRPWLPTCSTTGTVTSTASPPKLPHSDDSSSSTSDTTTTTAGATSPYSLHSNASLQTLPSLPSLQTLPSPDSLSLSATHRRLSSLPTHVTSLLLHHHLLYAAADNLIHVFDTTTSTLLYTFAADHHSGAVKSLTLLNGKIFTAHQDSKIRAWKLTENKHYRHFLTLPTLQDKLLNLFFHKKYVNVRRHRRRPWVEHHDAITGLSRIDDRFMCSVSWDRYLKIWDVLTFRCVESVKAHDDAVNAVVVAAGSGMIYTGSADRRIRVWGPTAGKSKYALVATLEKHKSAVNALALAETGSVLFSGSCDRSILVWEREDSANHMAVSGALRGHSKAVLCLVTTVSDLLLSGSADRTVRIWQRGREGKFCCLTVLYDHEKPVRSLVADMDSSANVIKVFSGSFDGEIKAWKVEIN